MLIDTIKFTYFCNIFNKKYIYLKNHIFRRPLIHSEKQTSH